MIIAIGYTHTHPATSCFQIFMSLCHGFVVVVVVVAVVVVVVVVDVVVVVVAVVAGTVVAGLRGAYCSSRKPALSLSLSVSLSFLSLPLSLSLSLRVFVFFSSPSLSLSLAPSRCIIFCIRACPTRNLTYAESLPFIGVGPFPDRPAGLGFRI